MNDCINCFIRSFCKLVEIKLDSIRKEGKIFTSEFIDYSVAILKTFVYNELSFQCLKIYSIKISCTLHFLFINDNSYHLRE